MGTWPRDWPPHLVAMLPKEGSGDPLDRQPLVLLPVVCRLWAAPRAGVMRNWLRSAGVSRAGPGAAADTLAGLLWLELGKAHLEGDPIVWWLALGFSKSCDMPCQCFGRWRRERVCHRPWLAVCSPQWACCSGPGERAGGPCYPVGAGAGTWVPGGLSLACLGRLALNALGPSRRTTTLIWWISAAALGAWRRSSKLGGPLLRLPGGLASSSRPRGAPGVAPTRATQPRPAGRARFQRLGDRPADRLAPWLRSGSKVAPSASAVAHAWRLGSQAGSGCSQRPGSRPPCTVSAGARGRPPPFARPGGRG